MNPLSPNFVSRRSQLSLERSTRTLERGFERLSSGLRINSAADDAAGLSISTRMRSQVEGLQQAVRNTNDSISLYQTAEGGLNEIHNILQRNRELAVQAANGVLSDSDREAIQAEVNQLNAEVDRIAQTTSFNGRRIFAGDQTEYRFQIGANRGEDQVFRLRKMDSQNLGRQSRHTGISGVNTGAALNAGDLTINGVQIRSTSVADDKVSKLNEGFDGLLLPDPRSSSAIAKAAAINSAYEFTGVRAIVGETRTSGSDALQGGGVNALVGSFKGIGGGAELTNAGLNAAGVGNADGSFELTATTYMEINGAKISGFTVQSGDTDGALQQAINARFEETGVIAEVDAQGRLELIAKDGRNIHITYYDSGTDASGNGAASGRFDNLGSDLEALIGLRDGDGGFNVYGGTLTLQSEDSFEMNLAGGVNGALGGVAGGNLGFAGPAVMGSNKASSLSTIDLQSVRGAERAIELIDFAIEEVSEMRGELGALQNRAESTISNLGQTAENLSAATSRIRDADFAAETASLTSAQIQQQAATGILSQVSASGQLVLSLLG